MSPNMRMYLALASVRAILLDGLDEDKLFPPVAPAFARYSADKFEFVLGNLEAPQSAHNDLQVLHVIESLQAYFKEEGTT